MSIMDIVDSGDRGHNRTRRLGALHLLEKAPPGPVQSGLESNTDLSKTALLYSLIPNFRLVLLLGNNGHDKASVS